MKRLGTENIASWLESTRERLARLGPRQRTLRSQAGRSTRLKWWLIYGSTRSGTTYMAELAKTCSRLWLGDWGLGPILEGMDAWRAFRSLPIHDYIDFDYRRLLQDVSRNILENAYPGNGQQLDMVYKQAGPTPKEYEALVAMWGPPRRIIFCLREPAGFVASAAAKFPQGSVEELQEHYVTSLDQYTAIRGDIFEYTPAKRLQDYIRFLRPLDFEGKKLMAFRYRGTQDHQHTSEEMWATYHRIKGLTTAV